MALATKGISILKSFVMFYYIKDINKMCLVVRSAHV